MLALIVVITIGYLVGSIPAGVLIARRQGSTDIRRHGSGGTGFTNVARVLGWKTGLAVLVADVGKGLAAAGFVARLRTGPVPIGDEAVAAVTGLAAVVGHVWPVFGRFRGGKGVATAAGVLLAVRPMAALLCAAIYGAVVLATGVVSLASVCVALLLPAGLVVVRLASGQPFTDPLLGLAAALALLIPFAHRSNIARLRAGSEPTVW